MQQLERPRFVFVDPRVDVEALKPPQRADLSDLNRRSQAPERSAKPALLELLSHTSGSPQLIYLTEDEDVALALGQRVVTGTWFMNRCDYLDPALAWTGVKDSGRGCTLSKLGLETFTRPKSFHLKLAL